MSSASHYRLSPYCVMHSDSTGRNLILHHALYGSRFELPNDTLPAIAAMQRGADLETVLASQTEPVCSALHVLIDERILEVQSHQGAQFENRLSPVELCVQRGFNEGGYDADRARSNQSPPIGKSYEGRPTVALTRHSQPVRRMDLMECLAKRRSSRAFGAVALPKQVFEQFLQYSCAAQAILETPTSGTVALRPYPGAGGLHALEIYPLVIGVEAIEDGLYHYDAIRHQLYSLDSEPAHRRALLDQALFRMGPLVQGVPAVLFVVTARVDRMCWKYTGMAYQALLMETGALYQTMHLVATALDLALCAVGAFPERATAEILGLDSTLECQVGLLALGAHRADLG